ncbi:MAG: hypothetical protein VXZ40_03435 [Nanoarchaeota archaeon]|nr:hypothetical protein [Nanoarchaeota archaeon]
MFDFFFHKGTIKEFSKKYIYSIERLHSLGKGHYSEVYSYKIIYYKNNSIWATIYLAGKEITSNFEEYESKFSYLKKQKLLQYTVRKFNLDATTVDCINFDKEILNRVIFMSDFTLQNYSVMPINTFTKPNIDLFHNLSRNQIVLLFEQLFDSWLQLTKESLLINEFDPWLVLYNEREVHVVLVDLDFIVSHLSNKTLKYSYHEFKDFISYLSKPIKDIAISILSKEKYREIIYEYEFPDFNQKII